MTVAGDVICRERWVYIQWIDVVTYMQTMKIPLM